MNVLLIIVSSFFGAVVSSLLTCVPGLHVYNVLGFCIIGMHALGGHGVTVLPEVFVPFIAGMIVGYSIINTIPSVFFAAPDESAFFVVLPGQKYLISGRGYEGALITGIGGLAGLFLLVLVVGPLAPVFLKTAYAVLQPHTHWILWCVICFMLLSEWQRDFNFGQAGWPRLLDAWKSAGAGLLTFFLSGLLGFILFYRSPVSAERAFQNLMPGFVGLFTMPWLILNIAGRVEIPEQKISVPGFGGRRLFHGVFAGGLGGGFAAFFPVVTGGVGGFLAGHAAAIRDDRVFLISQGASKLIYYAGGFLLLFVPGLNIIRGGGAQLLSIMYYPRTYYDYYMALASIAIAGAVSFLMLGPLARATIALIKKVGYKMISWIALFAVAGIALALTGLTGLLIMLVGTGIGLIPVMFGSRRMNCLGVILLPLACNMSGVGEKVASWLGLLG